MPDRTVSRRTALYLIPAAAASWLEAAAGAAAPADSFRGVDGKSYQPFAGKARKPVALIFLSHQCPISNALAPELARIAADYGKKGAAVFGVYPDPTIKVAEAREHARSFGLKFTMLLDPEQKLVRRAGVRVTPEAALFTAAGELAYRGRINDLYVDLGQKRGAPTTNDLRAALDAVLSGKPVITPRTTAIGCFIPSR